MTAIPQRCLRRPEAGRWIAARNWACFVEYFCERARRPSRHIWRASPSKSRAGLRILPGPRCRCQADGRLIDHGECAPSGRSTTDWPGREGVEHEPEGHQTERRRFSAWRSSGDGARPSLRAIQSETKVMVDTIWALVTAMLVFFMNLGFALVESGLCRAKKRSTSWRRTSSSSPCRRWRFLFGLGPDVRQRQRLLRR